MQLDNLKKGFFGYRKESVYRYIAAAEEEFSAKLMEKDEQNAKTADEYRRRIQELETALAALKEEHEAQKSNQMRIADTLLEAQSYAARLQEESETKAREFQKALAEEAEKQRRELEIYQERIQELRGRFCTLLKEMDEGAEALAEQVEEMKDKAPAGNMSLFQRKKEPVL